MSDTATNPTKRHLHLVVDNTAERPVARERRRSPATYARRRVAVAGVALGLLAAGGRVAGEVVSDAHDRVYGTDVPSSQDIQESPDQYVERKVLPGETLFGIAGEYTTDPHDIRNNEENLIDQNGGISSVGAGDVLMVPPKTVPSSERQDPPMGN